MHDYKKVIDALTETQDKVKNVSFSFFEPVPFAGPSAYVDGGNACILQMPWAAVHLIRGSCCVLKGTSLSSVKKWDFFLVAKQHDGGCSLAALGAPPFFQHPKFLNVSCIDAGTVIRDQLEHAIIDWAKALPVEFLVKDGLAEGPCELPFPLLGLAKTTKEGHSALAQQQGVWAAEDDGNMFCRLHEKAYTMFRYNAKRDTQSILAKLAFLSRDLVFPGYPYGLILADNFARVTNNEQKYILCLFEGLGRKEWAAITSGMRLMNAHAILDTIL